MTKTNQNLQEVEEESLTPEEHLEAILFQFVNLYERWSEDRQIVAKQSADIAKFIKEFAQRVGEFAKLEEKVRNDIHTSMRNEAENMAVYLGQTIGDAAKKEVLPTVKKLEAASEEASHNLMRYHSELSIISWKMIGMTIFTAIFMGLLSVWLLMPKPTLPLTKQQIDTYTAGETFQIIFPKLSVRQQQWLFDVAKGKVKNNEKLVQDTKKDSIETKGTISKSKKASSKMETTQLDGSEQYYN